MLIVFVWSWKVMAVRWKARGSRWWIRHPAACVLSSFAGIGLLIFSMGLGIATSTEEIEGGLGDAIFSAFVMTSPLLIAVWSTRNKSTAQPPAKPTAQPPAKPTAQSVKIPEKKKHAVLTARPAFQQMDATSKPKSVNLKFIYEDAQGNMSAREVSSWRESKEYIDGFCLAAGEGRTFRKDRILRFISGDELLQIPSVSQSKSTQKAKVSKTEILFTGFSSEDRLELEQKAKNAGMMVRKSVTQNLHYLCAGENAGPNKIAEAEHAGTIIIDESEFNDLVELGLVPGQ
ncbi:MAG: BRCT domain-containing protein [Pseudohongiella sp.]|nr:BRCT domain-containing protein [Pseudohongiella sp.]